MIPVFRKFVRKLFACSRCECISARQFLFRISMSLPVLSKRWPGRESQIKRLITATGTAGTPPLFVYGTSSTGKTSIVRLNKNSVNGLKKQALNGLAVARDVLRELKCATAYVNCVEWTLPRPLLQSILSQLKARICLHVIYVILVTKQ